MQAPARRSVFLLLFKENEIKEDEFFASGRGMSKISIPQPLRRRRIIEHQTGHPILVQLRSIERLDLQRRFGIPAEQIAVPVMFHAQIVEQVVFRHPEITEQLLVCTVQGAFQCVLARPDIIPGQALPAFDPLVIGNIRLPL